jgi:hypothetical protein
MGLSSGRVKLKHATTHSDYYTFCAASSTWVALLCRAHAGAVSGLLTVSLHCIPDTCADYPRESWVLSSLSIVARIYTLGRPADAWITALPIVYCPVIYGRRNIKTDAHGTCNCAALHAALTAAVIIIIYSRRTGKNKYTHSNRTERRFWLLHFRWQNCYRT